jgi:hypothetical protein
MNDFAIGADFLKYNNSVLFCSYGILMNSVDDQKADSLQTWLYQNNYGSTPFLDLHGNKIPKDITAFVNTSFLVRAEINGNQELLLVDTGACYTTNFKEHSTYLDQKIKKTNTYLSDSSGKHKDFHIVQIDSLKINDTFFLKNERIGIVDTKLSMANQVIFGTLGMDLLSKKRVILDFGNFIMYYLKD